MVMQHTQECGSRHSPSLTPFFFFFGPIKRAPFTEPILHLRFMAFRFKSAIQDMLRMMKVDSSLGFSLCLRLGHGWVWVGEKVIMTFTYTTTCCCPLSWRWVLELSSHIAHLHSCHLLGGALKATFQLHVAKSRSEDGKAKDWSISAIWPSLRVNYCRFWDCLGVEIVNRYFHLLLSVNTFCTRNVQRRGFSAAAGLNVHQTPFCFVFPMLLFIYSQPIIPRSCFFTAQSAVYTLLLANSAITCSTAGPGSSRSVPIFANEPRCRQSNGRKHVKASLILGD